MNDPLEERLLLLTSREVEVRRVLVEVGVQVAPCASPAELADALGAGAGAVLLDQAWLTSAEMAPVLGCLDAQPEWSELPVLILCSPKPGLPQGDTLMARLGNVTLLEVPLRLPTLITSVQSALRSRRRQYQIRAHLQDLEAAQSALRESEELLRFSLEAGRLGFWQHHVGTDELFVSDRCKAHFGRSPAEQLTHEQILASVHPEDRERAQAVIAHAIRGREAYDLEYRVLWPDGTLRWLMVRGRARYDAAGRPLHTHGVTLDITERKAAEALQDQQAEELRAAARRKDEFLAVLAHELRNPLSPVAHALEILRAEPAPETEARIRGVLERQLQHMTRLIDDLLDISRFNTGKIVLRKQRLDLVPAVQAAAESVLPFAATLGHSLELRLPPDPVFCEIDPVRFEQVVTNLVNNAAKYTRPGGHIRVVLTSDGPQARLRVQDTGIGIPPELLSQIFELFTQGQDAPEHARGGLGLGLALVRSLVELHGGTVEAFSEGPDRGSEFALTLPLSAEPSAASNGTHVAPSPPRRLKSRRLLVADDNRDSAETLAEMAQLWGFEVQAVFDGASALERVREWEPGIVCLDIGMPGLSGYEVARRLRAGAGQPELVLIALTGYGQEEDRRRSREAGFDHHLVKPVNPADLKQLLAP